MNTKALLLAASVLAAPAAASAQQVSGLYVGAGIGAEFSQDRRLEGRTRVLRERTDPGFIGVASVGYGFGNGFRAEIQAGDRQSGVHSLHGLGVPTAARGYEKNYGAMLNGYYDFPADTLGLGMFGLAALSPYLGAGVGWQHSEFDSVGARGRNLALRSNSVNDTLALQGIVGVSYPVASVPGLSFTGEYRLSGDVPDGASYKMQVFSPGRASGLKQRADEGLTHSGLIGLRYAFGASAPQAAATAAVPVPVPAVPVASTFLVFFDWDRADLTERARQVVASAAQGAARGNFTRIEVGGHTDSSGTAAYNRGLGERRASAVAAELVRDGVARSAISVRSYGETRPLVATAANVREPQNRRVEIVLR